MSVPLLRWAGMAVLLLLGAALPIPAQAETIQGFPQSSGHAGLVSITVQGDPLIHTGILVSPNLALTGKRWFSYSTNPTTVPLAHGHRPGQPPVTQTATDLWLHPTLDLALVRVGSSFANTPPFSFASAVPANNTHLFCVGFSAGGEIKRAELRVQGNASNGYVALSRARTDIVLNDGSGMPCFIDQAGFPSIVITGIAVSTTGTDVQSWQHQQVGAPSFKDRIPNMVFLSGVQALPLARAFSLYTKPDPTNPNLKMCLDVPGRVDAQAPVNQHACHDGPNQLFFWDNRPDRNFPAIVHMNSGMCLDIPGGSRNSGTRLQQYPCHNGPNQGWEAGLFNPQGSGFKYRPKHAVQVNADCV